MEGTRRSHPPLERCLSVAAYQDSFAYIAGQREGRALSNGFELLAQSEDRTEDDEHAPPEGYAEFNDPFEPVEDPDDLEYEEVEA